MDRTARLRIILLFALFCAGIVLAVSVWWSGEKERHHSIHRYLELKTFIEEGAGIGAIVDALRKEQRPIETATFLPVYTNLFSTRFTVRTNNGEFVLDRGRVWTVRLDDGVVRGRWPGIFHSAREIEQLVAVDFSRPLDEALLNRQFPSEASDFKSFFENMRKGISTAATKTIQERAQ